MVQSNRYKSSSGKPAILVSILLILIFAGCQDWLPTAYQDETFTAGGAGKTACDFFASDSGRVVGTVSFSGTEMDSLWIEAPDGLIDTTFSTLTAEQVYRIENGEAQDTLYAIFRLPGGVEKQEIQLFLTYELNAQNAETFVNVDLIDKNGEPIGPVHSDLSPENIAGCTQTVNIGGQDVDLPSIRTKLQTQVSGSPVLIRFRLSEPAKVGAFRIVIL